MPGACGQSDWACNQAMLPEEWANNPNIVQWYNTLQRLIDARTVIIKNGAPIIEINEGDIIGTDVYVEKVDSDPATAAVAPCDHLTFAGVGGITVTVTEPAAAHANIEIDTRAIFWAKASANWTNATNNGAYVACHPCDDRTGANEVAGINFNVFLPRWGVTTGGRIQNADPNVRDDDVIGYMIDAGGSRICVTGYLDDRIGAIKIWTDTTNIPAGWALCDGGSGTIDLRGRFIIGWDATNGAGDGSEAYGQTGGFRLHGPTENTHAGYAGHTHPLNVSILDVLAAAPDPTFKAPVTYSTLGVAEALGDADNRPRYYALAYIQRIN